MPLGLARRSPVRLAAPMPLAAQVVVELVARHEPGPDPAGDRPQLPLADQRANLVLGAAQLGRDLADGEWCGPVHPPNLTWGCDYRTAIASTSTIISGRARALIPTAVDAGCAPSKNSPLIRV